ncbi:helix-turn-helix domain-containing protein [Streptococcus thermophilus]|nr:XRE family transcriptional regulator [Streptococcus thermophilus]UYX68448.1 helix-turn-helix domain-containing protein [Streptococcus thermophilus]
MSALGSSPLTKLRNNNCVTTDNLLKICNVLNCELKDIIELKENSDA